MSEQPKEVSTGSGEFRAPEGIEWLWWGLLVVSVLTGFGLTIFAPI